MKFFEAHKAAFGNAGTLMMGTGPWELDSFDPTTGAELAGQPALVGAATVPITAHLGQGCSANETSLELAMRAGEVDLDPYILDSKRFAAAAWAAALASLLLVAPRRLRDEHASPGRGATSMSERPPPTRSTGADIIAAAGRH